MFVPEMMDGIDEAAPTVAIVVVATQPMPLVREELQQEIDQ